ncbi:MAG: hypothetical protein U0790_13940 [Isosphaeraceae bacterium]
MTSIRPRWTRWLAALTSALSLVGALASVQGCSAEPEFDKAAMHTPESLVQEFVIRYKRLPEHATAKQKAQAARIAKAQAALPDPDAPSFKSERKEAATKQTERQKTETLDHLLDTLTTRLGQLRGISRSDAAKKATELISKEAAIKEEDRQAVIDRLGKL